MAYDKAAIFQEAVEAIEAHKLLFMADVVAYVSCSEATLYLYFPSESEELETLKALLNKNKVNIKVSMRNKWYKSDNATLQMGLMKIIGTEEEAHRLNGTVKKIDVTSGGKSIGENFGWDEVVDDEEE